MLSTQSLKAHFIGPRSWGHEMMKLFHRREWNNLKPILLGQEFSPPLESAHIDIHTDQIHSLTENELYSPTAMASKLVFLRRLPRLLKPSSSSSIRRFSFLLLEASRSETTWWSPACRTFCSRPLNLGDDPQGPAAIDYRCVNLCCSVGFLRNLRKIK